MKISLKAVCFSFVLLLLSWWMQVENSCAFIHAKGNDSISQEFIAFLLAQQQNLMVFVLTFLLFSGLIRLRISKGFLSFIFFFLGLYLLLNQLFYQLYFNHFHFNFDTEGQAFGLAPFWDSILSLLDVAFFLKLILLLLTAVFLHRLSSIQIEYELKGKARIWLGVTVILFLVYGILIENYERPWRNLEKHPFVSLFQSGDSDEKLQLLSNVKERQQISYALKYGEAPPETNVGLNAYVQQKKLDLQKPNIIYFILESVGAYNLLVDGDLDATLTPNLYQWQKNSLLFRRMYNTFPATTRSHIPIQTGGKTITWGNVQDEMRYDYTGPTLTKALKEKDYSTALFSTQFLEYGELLNWYNEQAFDLIVNPDSLPEEFVDQHHLNSWGIKEEAIVDTMNRWIENYSASEPFFIEFMNSGTHHPYSTPDSFRPNAAQDNLSQYQRAIQYVDSLIGQIMKTLQERNLMENTIICISGDHGQAFGQRHYENLLHKNYIYEENIRNFFLIIDPSAIESPIVSDRPAFIGDIMPTLLAYTDSTAVKHIPGQNLLDSNYEERIHYFHKSSYPELWGLVDERWKFIEKKIGQAEAQLFDLYADEGELNNLADLHPEKVNYYRKLLPSWYLETNRAFRDELLAYHSPNDKDLTVEDITTEGIKFLEFVAKGKGKEFVKKERFHPKENIIVWLQTSFFPENKPLQYRWTSPSGKVLTTDLYFDQEWVTYWRVFEREGQLEEGMWTCGIYEGEELLISNHFEVSEEEALLYPYIFEAGPVELLFGVKTPKGYIHLNEIHPDEPLIAFAQINPYQEDKKLLFEWESPSREKFRYWVDCKAKWNYTWLILSEGEAMEEGLWKIQVSDGEEKLIESRFTVSATAKLYQPFTKN